jgi:DNA-binding MarR family transcriptional regulator
MIDLHGREAALRESIELLFFAYRAFTAGPDRILAQRGLGRVHHRLLYFVGRNPDVPVKTLLQILAVSKQALNAPLRQLLDEGLVVARSDERDRRYKRLRLTKDGERLEAQLTGTQMRHLAAAFTRVGSPAQRGWLASMKAIAEAAP